METTYRWVIAIGRLADMDSAAKLVDPISPSEGPTARADQALTLVAFTPRARFWARQDVAGAETTHPLIGGQGELPLQRLRYPLTPACPPTG